MEDISANYVHNTLKQEILLVFLIATLYVPQWLFELILRRAQPLLADQPLYPRLAVLGRGVYITRRAINHVKRMDFSVLTGPMGYLL